MEPSSKGTSKYIVGIIIIALVILGTSFMNRDKKAVTKEGQEEAVVLSDTMPAGDSSKESEMVATYVDNTLEVVYTDENGFTPDHLSVKLGDTVTFVNKSKNSMWVGADQHPTHTEYDGTGLREHCAEGATPSFDQCDYGASYSFTFTKVGEWNYHNHARATMRGVINVK